MHIPVIESKWFDIRCRGQFPRLGYPTNRCEYDIGDTAPKIGSPLISIGTPIVWRQVMQRDREINNSLAKQVISNGHVLHAFVSKVIPHPTH